MLPQTDYHMHTPLCGHAVGSPEEYVGFGLKAGLKEMGFSDHAPMVNEPMPGITMDLDELPLYHRMIEEVRAKYAGRIIIKTALESDFIPGFEAKTKAINQIYRDYYALVRQSSKSGFFNIIGHCDLPKKFGYRPTADLTDEIKATAKVFKETGVAVEINTSGLRKPVKEMYPAPPCLKIYHEAGVPLTFGSDAHDPKDVGRDFDKAVDLAKSVGYSEYLIFKQRKIERTVKI